MRVQNHHTQQVDVNCCAQHTQNNTQHKSYTFDNCSCKKITIIVCKKITSTLLSKHQNMGNKQSNLAELDEKALRGGATPLNKTKSAPASHVLYDKPSDKMDDKKMKDGKKFDESNEFINTGYDPDPENDNSANDESLVFFCMLFYFFNFACEKKNTHGLSQCKAIR